MNNKWMQSPAVRPFCSQIWSDLENVPKTRLVCGEKMAVILPPRETKLCHPFFTKPIFHPVIVWDEIVFVCQYKQGQIAMHLLLCSIRSKPKGMLSSGLGCLWDYREITHLKYSLSSMSVSAITGKHNMEALNPEPKSAIKRSCSLTVP